MILQVSQNVCVSVWPLCRTHFFPHLNVKWHNVIWLMRLFRWANVVILANGWVFIYTIFPLECVLYSQWKWRERVETTKKMEKNEKTHIVLNASVYTDIVNREALYFYRRNEDQTPTFKIVKKALSNLSKTSWAHCIHRYVKKDLI